MSNHNITIKNKSSNDLTFSIDGQPGKSCRHKGGEEKVTFSSNLLIWDKKKVLAYKKIIMDFSTRYKITLSFDKAKGKKLDISAVGPGPALPDDNVTIEDDDTN